MTAPSRTPWGLLLLLCLLLAGCERATVLKDDGWMIVQDGNGSAGVKEIVLPSGTRCVALIGYYKGAITCDFR